jgi:nucleoside-diphosphate-sugar epimerase
VDRVVHLAGVAHSPDSEQIGRHLECVNVQGTERLALAAAATGVRRLIFVSSALVHGTRSGSQPIAEADPLRPEDAYASSKAQAEFRLRKIVLSTGMELVIVRPPMVYGAGASGNFRRLVRLVRTGVPLPLGRATAPRCFIGIENLADVVARCVSHPAASGKTFLVDDGSPSSTADLVEKISHALGRNILNLRISPAVVQWLARLAGRNRDFERLFAPFALNTSRVATELGWNAPLDMSLGVHRAVGAQPLAPSP